MAGSVASVAASVVSMVSVVSGTSVAGGDSLTVVSSVGCGASVVVGVGASSAEA